MFFMYKKLLWWIYRSNSCIWASNYTDTNSYSHRDIIIYLGNLLLVVYSEQLNKQLEFYLLFRLCCSSSKLTMFTVNSLMNLLEFYLLFRLCCSSWKLIEFGALLSYFGQSNWYELANFVTDFWDLNSFTKHRRK